MDENEDIIDDLDEALAEERLDDQKEILEEENETVVDMLPSASSFEDSIATPTSPSQDENREKFMDLPKSMPYHVETLAEMDARLDFIMRRLVDCVEAKDFTVGFIAFNHRLECWLSLRYPMARKTRARLARFYYQLCVTPGLEARIVDLSCNMAQTLLESKKRIDIHDLVLPWKPLYDLLEQELYPKQRKTGLTNIANNLMTLADTAQRFFPPHEAPNMLATFLPWLNGQSLETIIATQGFMAHFLPMTHPREWLDAVFCLWESFNSSVWDSKWLDLMSRLAEIHLDAKASHPDRVDLLRNFEQSWPEPASDMVSKISQMRNIPWQGIRKDVGIFSMLQWNSMMAKALKMMKVPVGRVGKTSGFLSSVSQMESIADTKPFETIASIATMIIYSISEDVPASSSPSTSATNSGTSTPMGTATPASSRPLAGSHALDSLYKFMQATETFFHPSNYGEWSMCLNRFTQNLASEFLRRYIDEQKPECKTPVQWRLTAAIKKEFALTLRTVSLLSMYSKDPLTNNAAHSTMKVLAYLEPDLIIPSLLERAEPALETVLETHRTTATLSVLAQTAIPLISRETNPSGAKHVTRLLELATPGLDVNDPMKTVITCMYVISTILAIGGPIEDLTKPEHASDAIRRKSSVLMGEGGDVEMDASEAADEAKRSKEEEDNLLRDSTRDFPDWVFSFWKSLFNVVKNLPEPGKGGRSGKIEDMMTSSINTMCEYICSALSPTLFDEALRLFFDFAAHSPRANAAKIVGSIAAKFAQVDAKKVLALFFPLCDKHIRSEIENGAASSPSTSANLTMDEDPAFQYYCMLLTGTLASAGDQLLPYQDQLISLLNFMRDNCRSERGYSHLGRLTAQALSSLTSVYPRDARYQNPEVWQDPSFVANSHLEWGATMEAKDVEISWHVPTEAEVELALRILREITDAALKDSESLVDASSTSSSRQWACEFSRHCTALKYTWLSVAGLATLDERGEKGAECSDSGDHIPGFLNHPTKCATGIALQDPADPRHQFVISLRQRTGQMLHAAIIRLKDNGADDAIDSVKLIVSTIKTLMLDFPIERSQHASFKKSYDLVKTITRVSKNQKKSPRIVWIRRAALYNASRLRVSGFYRSRTAIDDQLIHDLADLSLSLYVAVRKVAQRAIESLTQYYDGTRTLLMNRFFDACKAGTNSDVMKGSLYVLGSKAFGNFAIADWRFGPKYIVTILSCQHQEKPSVQTLVKNICGDFIVRASEPVTLTPNIRSPGLEHASQALSTYLVTPKDVSLNDAIAAKVQGRLDQKNVAYEQLVNELLTLAKSSQTHWRYKANATRFLRAFIRRDQPCRPDIGAYMSDELVSELPALRVHAVLALTKMLHFVKLRSLCGGSPERLLLQKTQNPLKQKVKLEQPLDPNYTENFIKGLRSPMEAGKTLLMDKQSTGWLVWGDEVEYYTAPRQTGDQLVWEQESDAGLQAIREVILNPEWWTKVADHYSREQSRDFLAQENTALIKSIFQIFSTEACELAFTVTDQLLNSDKDRHKIRAACEILGGMLRGSKHWPLEKQNILWSWLEARLPSLMEKLITPDTQPAVEMLVEYVLGGRDPRRNQPLVQLITQYHLDPESNEAFAEAKKAWLVGTAMRSLGWHFEAWADGYLSEYWSAIDNNFQEVRSAVSDNLRRLSELRLHPSFSSTAIFLQHCKDIYGDSLLLEVDDTFEQRVRQLKSNLEEWRKNRQPSASGTQQYDRASLTVLTWIWASANDHRISAVYPFVRQLIPELFSMQELNDNEELRSTARSVLASLAGLPYPAPLVRPIFATFITLLRTSSSWRVRLDVLPVLQVFFFHQLFCIEEEQIVDLMSALCDMLRDSSIEVREAAATTLSGIVRCSQRRSTLQLRDRFLAVVRTTKIPRRRTPNGEENASYQEKLTQAHSGVLGAAALIQAFPNHVPSWMPQLLLEVMGKHVSSPAPIAQSVRNCLADFKKSHSDSWVEDQKAFTDDEQMELNDLLVPPNNYLV